MTTGSGHYSILLAKKSLTGHKELRGMVNWELRAVCYTPLASLPSKSTTTLKAVAGTSTVVLYRG